MVFSKGKPVSAAGENKLQGGKQPRGDFSSTIFIYAAAFLSMTIIPISEMFEDMHLAFNRVFKN